MHKFFRPSLMAISVVFALSSAAPALAAADDAPMPNVQIENRTSLSGFSVSTGATYWQGDFGAPTTSELFIALVNLRYEFDGLRVWGTLPYMRVESDGVLFAGTDGGPILVDTGSPSPAGRVRNGFGDVTLGATYAVVENGGDWAVDLSSRVKLPTASDESGLSTGKTDVGVSVDISRAVQGVVPFVSAGYTFLGDPDGYDLRNTVSASAGLSIPFGGDDTVALISYEYDRAATDFVDDGHELFGAVSGTVSDQFSWTGFGTVGLSEGASDFALGLLLSLSF